MILLCFAKMLERTCLLQFRDFLILMFKEAPWGFLTARDLGVNKAIQYA